jgi:CHASE3 domain sensor protein
MSKPSSPPPQRSSIRRKVVFGFGFVLVMLVLIALATWQSTRSFLRTTESIAETREVLELEEKILRHFAEMENGRASFLLTGDERYLGDYDDAHESLGAHYDRLKEITSDSPEQAQRVDRMKVLLSATATLHAGQVELRRVEGLEAATAAFAEPNHNELASQIRNVLFEIETRSGSSSRSGPIALS